MKPTKVQIDIMIHYMEEHPATANGIIDDTGAWDNLMELLNNAPGARKTTKAWKRVNF